MALLRRAGEVEDGVPEIPLWVEAHLSEVRDALRVGGAPGCKGQVLRLLNDRLRLGVEVERASLAIVRAQLLHGKPEDAILAVAHEHGRLARSDHYRTPLAEVREDLRCRGADVDLTIIERVEVDQLQAEVLLQSAKRSWLPDDDLPLSSRHHERIQRGITLPETVEGHTFSRAIALIKGLHLGLAEAQVIPEVAAKHLEAEGPVPAPANIAVDLPDLLVLGPLRGPGRRRHRSHPWPARRPFAVAFGCGPACCCCCPGRHSGASTDASRAQSGHEGRQLLDIYARKPRPMAVLQLLGRRHVASAALGAGFSRRDATQGAGGAACDAASGTVQVDLDWVVREQAMPGHFVLDDDAPALQLKAKALGDDLIRAALHDAGGRPDPYHACAFFAVIPAAAARTPSPAHRVGLP
mmetsp:Transcript_60790/g.130632  ORF Transcript_60790/g.130632 Transcript_60790/m.130632 type:complete len:410 (-) Transcript_60790:55-1284(-)